MLSVGGTAEMRISYRYLVLVMAVTVMVAGMAIPALAGPEGTLVSKINSSRAANGLAPLETYWDLTDDARVHSSRMLDKGEIYHSSSLGSVTGVWDALGENVGMGVDLSGLHNAFMNSSGHKANILGNYNYVGVGVKTDGNGVKWVTVIFMRAAPGLNGGGTPTTTTQPPATTTTTQPPATTTMQAPATTTTTQPPKKATTKSAATAVKASLPVASDSGEDLVIGRSGKLNFWD
jgi:hypothetical protein